MPGPQGKPRLFLWGQAVFLGQSSLAWTSPEWKRGCHEGIALALSKERSQWSRLAVRPQDEKACAGSFPWHPLPPHTGHPSVSTAVKWEGQQHMGRYRGGRFQAKHFLFMEHLLCKKLGTNSAPRPRRLSEDSDRSLPQLPGQALHKLSHSS